jgi:hypothetical protein
MALATTALPTHTHTHTHTCTYIDAQMALATTALPTHTHTHTHMYIHRRADGTCYYYVLGVKGEISNAIFTVRKEL